MLVYHVVGLQGVGKSSLISLLAADFVRRGRVCAGQDPDIFTSLEEAVRERPGADVYFIEHMRLNTVKAGPGDYVIQMDRVKAANDPAPAHQPAEQGVANA